VRNSKFNRLYFSGAAEVLCDKQGRILIPIYLKDYADIKQDVVIIGVSDRIEIWAKEAYENLAHDEEDFAALAEKIMQGTKSEEA